MDKYRVISADSHIIEPPDLWVRYIEPSYRDRAPHLERLPEGDVFKCEGVELPPIPISSSAGNRRVAVTAKGRWEEVVRKGAYDPHERMKDMALDGMDAEVVYPTLALRMFEIADPALQRAIFAAYNSWIADFCGAYPDRLKGIAMISLTGVESAMAEMRRVRKLGLAGAMVSIVPLGATYSGPAYDPFWATAQELQLPVSVHINTNVHPLRNATMAEKSILASHAQWCIADLIFNGVFARFPEIKVVSAENDAGWAPYLMQRMDNLFEIHRHTYNFEIRDQGLRPSEFFRRNVYLTFMEDRPAIIARDTIGGEHLMWSNDYPHKESTFPHSQQVLQRMFEGVPEMDKQRITCLNAARLYGFT